MVLSARLFWKKIVVYAWLAVAGLGARPWACDVLMHVSGCCGVLPDTSERRTTMQKLAFLVSTVLASFGDKMLKSGLVWVTSILAHA